MLARVHIGLSEPGTFVVDLVLAWELSVVATAAFVLALVASRHLAVLVLAWSRLVEVELVAAGPAPADEEFGLVLGRGLLGCTCRAYR